MTSSQSSESHSWSDWLRLVVAAALLGIAGVMLYNAITIPRSGLPMVNYLLLLAALVGTATLK